MNIHSIHIIQEHAYVLTNNIAGLPTRGHVTAYYYSKPSQKLDPKHDVFTPTAEANGVVSRDTTEDYVLLNMIVLEVVGSSHHDWIVSHLSCR